MASALDWSTHLVSAPTGRDAELPGGAQPNIAGEQMSSDGQRVVFQTWEQLVPADTNPDLDVYERSAGTTKLISATGPGDPAAGGRDAILAGDQIYFDSSASLVPEDTDGGLTDVYASSNGVIRLVSTPGAGANGPDQSARLVGAAADGSTAVFTSVGHLTGDDDDGCLCPDLFANSNGTTRLVTAPSSASTAGSPPQDFKAISSDGHRVFFSARESLTSDDVDGPCPAASPPGSRPIGCWDIYEWHDGQTQLVSAPESSSPTPANGDVGFGGISADGTHVFFTSASLVSGAPGGIYERFDGHTRLVSAPAPGGSEAPAGWVGFGGASADGAKVFFGTSASLAPEDTDGGQPDVYERSNGVTTLVSAPGPGANPEPTYAYFAGASRDGSHVFFYSAARYTTDDPNDVSDDVYERVDGVTKLVSAPGPDNPSGGGEFVGSSADGSRVFFSPGLSPGTGGLFEHTTDGTRLVSSPGPGGTADPNPVTVFGGVSDDGTAVLWLSNQRMTAADTDDREDLYQAVLGDGGPPDQPPDSEAGGSGAVAADVTTSPGIDVHRVITPKTWRKLINPGVRVLASCTGDCRMDVTVAVTNDNARALGLSSTTIAHGSAQAAAGEQHWVSAKAIRSVRHALRTYSGHGHLHITVTASASS